MLRSFRTRLAAGTIATLAVTAAFGAPAALAHVELKSTTPKAKSTVKAPSAVKLTFTGPIRTGSVSVKGPGGTTASSGKGGRDPRNINRLAVTLRSGLKAGKYSVSAKVVAADGHKETFTFWFKIKT
jgi:methionine-rich copper-binding protein CopC